MWWHGVLLMVCDLDTDDEISIPDALSVLAEGELDRVGRFRSELHGFRYARARAFLRRQLAGWTSTRAAALVFLQGANGKPKLEDGPHFNLSHCQGLAVLAINPSGPIGIDLEMLTPDLDVDGLAHSCLNQGEVQVLDALSGAERQHRFLAFWTAKEARMKLTGEGVSLGPSAIHLDLDAGWPVGIADPADPPTRIGRPDLGLPDAICSVATTATL